MLPTVISTSVIRSTSQGESHGGVYIVDLENNNQKQVIDWDRSDISWEGRGADRGLRGISFYEGNVFLAASDEIFIYDREFNLVNSITNKYLNHCHEIFEKNSKLYITSTGYDSILIYDIEDKKFEKGICIKDRTEISVYNGRGSTRLSNMVWDVYGLFGVPRYQVESFDPMENRGPVEEDSIHINNVWVDGGDVYVSGSDMCHLLRITSQMSVEEYTHIPTGTHNARPIGKNKILFNDTDNNQVCITLRNGTCIRSHKVPSYREENIQNNNLPDDHARQSFARGLCITDDHFLIGGSSPATISIYEPSSKEPIKSINLTMDIRNAIHGLEVWPY